jgi:hypothetical protein
MQKIQIQFAEGKSKELYPYFYAAYKPSHHAEYFVLVFHGRKKDKEKNK